MAFYKRLGARDPRASIAAWYTYPAVYHERDGYPEGTLLHFTLRAAPRE